jgi:hypothetical protein
VRKVRIPMMEAFLSDLKSALRGLRKNPTFTITAIVTLALGIAANGAIFSVINAALLQPLPRPDANRVVSIGRRGGGGVPEPVFAFWEQNNCPYRKPRLALLQKSCHYLLHDRDAKFCSFRELIKTESVNPLRLPARSPNLNSYAERWVRSVKEECLSRLILFGESSLRRALQHIWNITTESAIIRAKTIGS